MEIWLEKKDCTGCGACFNVCPKGAIRMVEDESGFKYPVINHDLCIDCGLCKRTCPVLKKSSPQKFDTPKVYAAWSKDKDNRFKSTSGGLFTEIVTPIIEKKGFVVGASYDENNMVYHKIVNDLEGLKELRQSKYLQSDTKNIYADTKKLLDNDKLIAFCGAPCQVSGLYKYLKKDYKNLLTIEFICRGMNSPKAYKAWLGEIEKSENKKVSKVWFKYKENGWKASPKCTRVDFTDGDFKVFNGNENTYMEGYLNSNLYIRPACGTCRFNGLPRQADITLADFWGINGELDDDEGTSLVIINTETGNAFFENIKDKIFYDERKLEEVYDGNICFSTAVDINKKSEEFLKNVSENNFSEMVKKYSKISLSRKLILKIKRKLTKK